VGEARSSLSEESLRTCERRMLFGLRKRRAEKLFASLSELLGASERKETRNLHPEKKKKVGESGF